MAAVDIGVGHDDDAVIARLLRVELLGADAGAERGDERADFGRAQHLVEARALDVEDLAFERQDRLEAPVAPLLGRTAGAVALDDEDLGLGGVGFLAICGPAREVWGVERAPSPAQLARAPAPPLAPWRLCHP